MAHRLWPVGSAALAAALLLLTSSAAAQDDPNPGALTVAGGLDAPTVYVFRGLVQEREPKLTLWPYVDVGVALGSGDGAIKSIGVNVGVWNSLNTGSSGSKSPFEHLHFEEDFYATLNLGFGGGLGVGVTYMALTYPNGFLDTVKELQVKITKTHRLNPYGFIATELTDVSGDGGVNKGTYLELGVAPAWSMGSTMTLAIPAKVGLSARDYYELRGEDRTFGFFDVGALVTIPLTGMSSRFGSWNIHGSVEAFLMGDTAEAANVNDRGETSKSRIVGLFGIGFTY